MARARAASTSERQAWDIVLAEAETRIPNLYSATFSARRFISIIDQQIRCFNLCYALSKSRRITKSSHLAIIGAGISGMTCAVALAMRHDCIVYVFERDTMLLRKFREAPFRYIHPDLNHRGGTDNPNLYNEPHKATDFPLMNWSGNYGPLFAEELSRKFDHYRASSNIALYPGKTIVAVRPKGQRVELELKETAKPRLRVDKLSFDLTIVASGFGNEPRDASSSDASYWHSGNPRHYEPPKFRLRRGAREKVLVSGNGDSGMIELAHLLLRDFQHGDIFSFLPLNDNAPLLSSAFSNHIAQLHFRRIEKIDPEFPDVIGPLAWYWIRRRIIESNPPIRLFDVKTFAGRCVRELYEFLHSHLRKYDVEEKPPALLIKRARVPTMAEHHNVAAVLRPCTLMPSRRMMPAPRKPMPETIWAATRVGSACVGYIAEKTTNPPAPSATSALVRSPAIF
jgi:hypothetical protein